MNEAFDYATKAEDIGRSLKELYALLVVIREAKEVEDDEVRAAVGAAAKMLSSLIDNVDDLQNELYQLKRT